MVRLMRFHWVRLSVVFALLAGMLGLATPTPAQAVDCQSNFPWDSETELVNYAGSEANGCIRTFVTDPGIGNLLSPDSTSGVTGLLTPQRVDYFVGRGFNRNFLWYAPRRTMTTGPGDTRNWSGCGVGIPEGGVCPVSALHASQMGPSFINSVTLHIIGDSSTFIALVCGNFSSNDGRTPSNPVPTPTPYIDGVKFRDDNRNGTLDAGEQPLAGWQIRITRLSSRVGQATGVVGAVTTDSQGQYRYDLSGQGPGRYRVEEVVQDGWKNYTPISYDVDVDFGVGAKRFNRSFGNAESVADVAKTAMTVVDAPDHLDVGAESQIAVSVTVENLGPADQVAIRDEIEAVLPDDCTSPEPRRSFTALLTRGSPVTRSFSFAVTCHHPSQHEFTFDDVLSITNSDITDINTLNNQASATLVAPVHAYTDLSATGTLSCVERTDVDVAADCEVGVTVTNEGFGSADVPVDATAAVQLALPDDCTADPNLATVHFPSLIDGSEVTRSQTFDVVCTHRSFHEIGVSVAITADDPHVFDTDPANNTAGDGPSIIEVFHDATMAVTDAHLVCDEQVGDTSFTCTADVEYSKTGPAPSVEAVLLAELGGQSDCSASPGDSQSLDLTLEGDVPDTRTFSWAVSCPAAETLHPFAVTADISPAQSEPHAVDEPGPISDDWVVPYCLPTVNPHGQKEPQAPGSGMNEDGFYIFGTLPGELGNQVSIRDDASHSVFGPFPSGTRIKWVEANGAQPTIESMGGNNGQGNGQALAVDYRIHAQGDAQAFFVDENGVEVSATCLVPPFPK